ncbi:MAG TPA: peptidoglycan editing factor PgeF, partial [Epsilonproteobacteria bacterium]|nr:peptidoglycan editing factor PgeF [Campylobacterota bacterium]
MRDLYRFSSFEKYDGLMHAVSTRSENDAYGFSLALHTGEEAAQIIQNREMLSQMLEKNGKLHFIVAEQTHSDRIEVIRESETRGWGSLEDAVKDCDALVTDLKEVVLTILTADCVPILLYDREKEIVAAVHAGWKGTKAQIAAKTVAKMQEVFGCDPENIIAGIAPSIGRCCYEVGEEVAEHFFDLPEGYTQRCEKYMLDLPYINKSQ